MVKYFKSIDEQLKLLKYRGLIIDDEKIAGDILLRYNYYKIINSTLPYFTVKDDEKKYIYRAGTDFQDLVDVHNFDKNLKRILLSQSLEIERIARSIISYKFVEKYPQKNSYLNVKNFNMQDNRQIKININAIEETIDKYAEEDNFKRSINYYLNKYKSVPFWFIINFLSFGKVINIYETLDYQLQEDIADEFQKIVEENLNEKLEEFLTPNMLQSFLANAREIRNIAAHDNLILDYHFEPIEYFYSIHNKYNISLEDERNKLFDTFIVNNLLLPVNLRKEILFEIKNLLNKLSKEVDAIAYEKILKNTGFEKKIER